MTGSCTKHLNGIFQSTLSCPTNTVVTESSKESNSPTDICAQSPALHAACNMQKFLGLILADVTNAECTGIHNKKYSMWNERYLTGDLEHPGQTLYQTEEVYNAETIWPVAR